MNWNIFWMATVFTLLSRPSMADLAIDWERGCRTVSFNVFCYYHRDGGHDGFEKCQAGSQFQKLVTESGDEVEDRSDPSSNPKFEVQCDGRILFNNVAHRFTDRQGTRLQAEAGPFPATVIPRGSLRDDHKYTPSTLELEEQTLKGFCYIYTGPQLR